ncbi:MAG: hypothetical protein KKB34_05095 [Bacteroidetes bacterium]|nr:hypothetical protein [Bacteroidota bacterium]
MKKLNRKHKESILFGRKVVLAQRDSYDIMMMTNFAMKNRGKLTPEVFLYETAKVVETGMKYSYKILPWYRVIKKLLLRRILRVNYLLKNLSQEELVDLSTQVYELEGINVNADKKKVMKKKQ